MLVPIVTLSEASVKLPIVPLVAVTAPPSVTLNSAVALSARALPANIRTVLAFPAVPSIPEFPAVKAAVVETLPENVPEDAFTAPVIVAFVATKAPLSLTWKGADVLLPRAAPANILTSSSAVPVPSNPALISVGSPTVIVVLLAILSPVTADAEISSAIILPTRITSCERRLES